MSDKCGLCNKEYNKQFFSSCPVCLFPADKELKQKEVVSDKLQEIKLLAQNAMATGKGHVDLTTYALTWLIEQIEQAQKKIKNLQLTVDAKFLSINKGDEEQRWMMQEENIRLTEANQKLVECLEWYADEDTWLEPDGAGILPIDYDEGQRARQTLSEVKGNG